MIILQQRDIGFNHGIQESARNGTVNTEAVKSNNAFAEIPMFQKTLAGTIYTVYVHFSQTSSECFKDKILRMLESEAVNTC